MAGRQSLEPRERLQRGQRKHIADRAQVGDLVRIAGRLKDSSYERDGVTHYTTDRIVEEFGILAAKGMPA
jgi:single-stranded DNA-binding protein